MQHIYVAENNQLPEHVGPALRRPGFVAVDAAKDRASVAAAAACHAFTGCTPLFIARVGAIQRFRPSGQFCLLTVHFLDVRDCNLPCPLFGHKLCGEFGDGSRR